MMSNAEARPLKTSPLLNNYKFAKAGENNGKEKLTFKHEAGNPGINHPRESMVALPRRRRTYITSELAGKVENEFIMSKFVEDPQT